MRINNNLPLWSSVSDPSRDRVDSFPATLDCRGNPGELDGWAVAFLGMASLRCKAKAPNKDERPCQLFRRNACHASRIASSRVVLCEHVRPRNLKSDQRIWQEEEPSSGYECQSVSCQTAGRLQTMRPARALPGSLRAPLTKRACSVRFPERSSPNLDDCLQTSCNGRPQSCQQQTSDESCEKPVTGRSPKSGAALK